MIWLLASQGKRVSSYTTFLPSGSFLTLSKASGTTTTLLKLVGFLSIQHWFYPLCFRFLLLLLSLKDQRLGSSCGPSTAAPLLLISSATKSMKRELCSLFSLCTCLSSMPTLPFSSEYSSPQRRHFAIVLVRIIFRINHMFFSCCSLLLSSLLFTSRLNLFLLLGLLNLHSQTFAYYSSFL